MNHKSDVFRGLNNLPLHALTTVKENTIRWPRGRWPRERFAEGKVKFKVEAYQIGGKKRNLIRSHVGSRRIFTESNVP